MHQGLNAAHFLRNETQAARTAVEALDKYILKLASFQDKALELTEEAHRWVGGWVCMCLQNAAWCSFVELNQCCAAGFQQSRC